MHKCAETVESDEHNDDDDAGVETKIRRFGTHRTRKHCRRNREIRTNLRVYFTHIKCNRCLWKLLCTQCRRAARRPQGTRAAHRTLLWHALAVWRTDLATYLAESRCVESAEHSSFFVKSSPKDIIIFLIFLFRSFFHFFFLSFEQLVSPKRKLVPKEWWVGRKRTDSAKGSIWCALLGSNSRFLARHSANHFPSAGVCVVECEPCMGH